jgi:hypothetical protein
LFLALLDFRPDIAAALDNPRLLFKWLLTLSLLASAMALTLQLARPEGASNTRWLVLAAAPVVLAMGIATELVSLPVSDWRTTMVGSNSVACMVLIPLLSAMPLVGLIYAMRQGAPPHPVLAGAVAGLAAAGIGGTLYGMHCTNDSPLFIGVWYVIAIAIVTAFGAMLGARWLRW